MNNTVQLNIPLGYKFIPHNICLSVEQARNILTGKKQHRVTQAEINDLTVCVTSHHIECPYCNHRVYAYARDFNKAFGCNLDPDYTINKAQVLEWASLQMSFFAEDKRPLYFNPVVNTASDLMCPKCKNTMKRSDKTRLVQITSKGHKVFIRTQVLDIVELFALPCLSGSNIRVEFPLYEIACFNFRNGHSYLRLESPDGRCLAVRDMTSNKNAWSSGAIYSILSKNKLVRRTIRDMFKQQWKGEIPFYPSELSVNELRMLTQFVGYDRDFYASIPMGKGSLEVDSSFKPQARKLRKAANIAHIYDSSKLPNMKSVRRVFFNNPGLFFYLDECERLWSILQDPNYFVELLSDDQLYKKLSDLHMRPMMFSFLEDFGNLNRKRNLMSMIKLHWYNLCHYAVNYSSMSPFMKKREQEKWLNHERVNKVGGMPHFALPMRQPTQQIRDCLIDDFQFSWLKTSLDYEEAGKALHNCLRGWTNQSHPVVCVRKQGKIIAAIEMRDNSVYQALTKHNRELTEIPGLLDAYAKWFEKNNLTKYKPIPINRNEDFLADLPDLFNLDEDDEDDLPF